MDFWKPFRSCFLCKGKKNLLRVEHPAYHTTFDYYHQECLQKVLDAPENYEKYVDSAIQITDQLRKDRENQESKERRLQESIRQLRGMREINKTLDELNSAIEKAPEIESTSKEQQTSKFEKIFKNG